MIPRSAFESNSPEELEIALSLGQTENLAAFFPAAFSGQDIDAFKTLQDISLLSDLTADAETRML